MLFLYVWVICICVGIMCVFGAYEGISGPVQLKL